MEQGFFSVVLQFGLVILVMANGFAIIFGGPQAAGRLNRWVGRTALRAVRVTLSWFIRQLANLLREVADWIGR